MCGTSHGSQNHGAAYFFCMSPRKTIETKKHRSNVCAKCLQPTFNPTVVFFPASLPDVHWPMETNKVYFSFEILKPSKMCQSLRTQDLLWRYNSQQNIRWNIWNPKSWSWMLQMMFLFHHVGAGDFQGLQQP